MTNASGMFSSAEAPLTKYMYLYVLARQFCSVGTHSTLFTLLGTGGIDYLAINGPGRGGKSGQSWCASRAKVLMLC